MSHIKPCCKNFEHHRLADGHKSSPVPEKYLGSLQAIENIICCFKF